MQMNEQVLTALEVLRNFLRNFAKNDFERHRIDVLEKDLTDPPKVEVIDETHQKFNGIVYHKAQNGHFRTAYSINRNVFEYYNGEIPEGYEFHHNNVNPADNDITNLQLLTPEEHKHLHNILNKQIVNCTVCGKTFESYTTNPAKNRFCSLKCKNIYQRKKHKNLTGTCAICGKSFKTNEYRPSRTCSKSCSSKLTHQKRTKYKPLKPKTTRLCPVCGKEFILPYIDKLPTNKFGGFCYQQPMLKNLSLTRSPARVVAPTLYEL